MDKFVARLYIHDYREKIAAEADDAQRQELLRLLAEEEAKLAVIGRAKGKSSASRKNLATPPICRSHVNQLLGFRVKPPLEDAAAWKDKGVRTVVA